MSRSRYDEPDEEEDDDSGDDWGAEDEYDPEDPETYPPGLYDDDGPATVPCPHCHAEILEDSEKCPQCGAYISREDAPRSGMAGPLVIVMILAMLAVMLWVFSR